MGKGYELAVSGFGLMSTLNYFVIFGLVFR